MQLIILAGGLGTRISEETDFIPKPMVRVGSLPIIWHIIKYYSCYGVKEVIICTGYKYEIIEEFFKNKDVLKSISDNIKVKPIFTGYKSNTGERIKKIRKFLNNDFFLTYGDGLSNVNIDKLFKFHKKRNKIATVTIVKPQPRFGKITLIRDIVKKIEEKKNKNEHWINGGFFVCNKKIFNFFKKKNSIFESDVLPGIARKKELLAYKHKEFWQPMDTLKEKRYLNDLWDNKKAPWKVWK